MSKTNTLSFITNNNGTMQWNQSEYDGSITIHTFHSINNFSSVKNDIIIPAGDMVMLANLYKHVKENDIQNDFINPSGKNSMKN